MRSLLNFEILGLKVHFSWFFSKSSSSVVLSFLYLDLESLYSLSWIEVLESSSLDLLLLLELLLLY
jgi:hypothetical protein